MSRRKFKRFFSLVIRLLIFFGCVYLLFKPHIEQTQSLQDKAGRLLEFDGVPQFYHPTCPPHPLIENVKFPYGFIPFQLRKEVETICQGASSIRVYGGSVVELQNIVLDFSKRIELKNQVIYDKGFAIADCKVVSAEKWPDGSVLNSISIRRSPAFDELIDSPVITITRDDCWNQFNILADSIQTFAAALVAELGVHDRHVMVLDEKVFVQGQVDHIQTCSSNGSLQALGRQNVLAGKEFVGKKIKFSKLVIPSDHSNKALLKLVWKTESCDLPEIVGMYVDNLFQFFGLESLHELTKKRKNDKIIRITWISERDKQIKGDDALLVNENELTQALKQIPGVAVTSVDLLDQPFIEQLNLMSKTDILIGVHGASLSNIIYTPLDSCLIEIIPHMSKSDQFSRLARATGRYYRDWKSPNTVNQSCKIPSKDEPNSKCPNSVQNIQLQVEIAIRSLLVRRFIRKRT